MALAEATRPPPSRFCEKSEILLFAFVPVPDSRVMSFVSFGIELPPQLLELPQVTPDSYFLLSLGIALHLKPGSSFGVFQSLSGFSILWLLSCFAYEQGDFVLPVFLFFCSYMGTRHIRTISSCGWLEPPSCSRMLLLLFFGVSPASCVCSFCFGNANGCSGADPNTCPWKVGLAANVAAVSTGAVIALDTLLPPKYLRLFTRPVLQVLGIIISKPRPGTPPNFAAQTVKAIYTAVVGGNVYKDEAISELNDRLTTEELKDSPNATLVKQLERAITMVQKATVKVYANDVVDGAYSFVLAKLSLITCTASASFDLCFTCEDDSEGSNGGGSKRYSATLKRPRTYAQMCQLLHQFQMVIVASGLASILAVGPFLEDVVYEPLRLGTYEWPIAFELVIIYLRMIENNPDRYVISNVLASGAIDVKIQEATKAAVGQYPGANFRGGRGEPRDVDADPNKGKEKVFKGDVKGDNPSSNKGCAAWNLGRSHLCKHVDSSTGKCTFKHACDQYVTDKGPRGQCLGDHKRAACTYDPAKKCKSPVQA